MNRSSQELIELEQIEVLDELSARIKQERRALVTDNDGQDNLTNDGANRMELQREPSIRGGLRLGDVLDEKNDDMCLDDSNQTLVMAREVLDSLKKLVDALCAQRKFLDHSVELDTVVGMVRSDMDPRNVRSLLCLTNLLRHTLDNHHKHPCTELRYVTLLEIMLSYHDGWEPSANVNVQWRRLSCKVDKGIDPVEFRRQAYQVLVSLPWVPTSDGLYTACSYEETESLRSWDELPLCLQSKLEKIPQLLLRSDRVHQILHKIRGRNSFTVAISSATPESNMHGIDYGGTSKDDHLRGAGIGKTTLAALLAAHPTISDEHVALWVDLEYACVAQKTGSTTTESSLSHKQYMDCLENLCLQLDGKPNWPDLVLRLEDSNLQHIRELEHMKVAKRCVMEALQRLERRILIVLDGVYDEKDFEWFHFMDDQSTIVVTGTQSSENIYIPQTTYSVDMEELGTDEAIALFASEASHDRRNILFQTVEAKTTVVQCLLHPLIVRTTGHWFKMKQVTAGFGKAMEELTLELSMLKHSAAAKSDALKALSDVMNMVLSPSMRNGGDPSKVMKLCLSSVAVVFANACVPMDAVLALWIDLCVTHPDAIAEVSDGLPDSELFKRVWYIAEAFMHLGIFSLSEDESGVLMVKLYHQLYVEYGLSLISDFTRGSTLADMKAAWHGSFVNGYNSRRKRLLSIQNAEDRCRSYALKRLIYHMIEAKFIPGVLELLKDESWCRERLSTHGWYGGSKLHVDDCGLLCMRAQDSKSATPAETRKVILTCLKKLAAVLAEETPNLSDDSRLGKAMALHLVGFTQANNGGTSEALTQYKYALATMTQTTHPFNAIIVYSQAVLHLVRNDHDKGVKKLKNCQKILKEADPSEVSSSLLLQQEVVQLKGDALIAACDYRGAEESYEEALDLMSDECQIETGTALFRRGRLHCMMGEMDQAIAALNESISFKLGIGERHSIGLWRAYSAAGDVYLEFQDYTEALKHYQHALDIVEELEEGNEFDLMLLNGKISFLKHDEDGYPRCFDAARDLVKHSPCMFMDQSASDLRIMAKIFAEGGRKEVAIEVLRDALELTKERPDSLERASVLYELGHCLCDLRSHKEGISCLQESLKTRITKLGNCELVLDTEVALGSIFKKEKMYSEYLACSKEVMFLTEKLYRGDETRAASAIFGVAEAYEILGEYDQAAAMYDECKERLRHALCNDHPDVANVLQRLGKLHSVHGDQDKSFDCYSMAVKILQANFEPNHPQLAETLYATGIVARKRGDYDGARKLLQEALQIQKQLELTNETCLSLIELGNVHRLKKESDIAVGCYQRCIDILEVDEGGTTVYAHLYLALGHARLSRNEISEATECYDNALRKRIELYGRDHADTATASRSMGIIKYLGESFAEARIYLSDFVRVMEGETKTDNVDYVLALVLLGEILDSEARHDDATKCWNKANAILDRSAGAREIFSALKIVVDRRLDSNRGKRPNSQEQKSLFSMFADMARFEEEVTSEIPVEQQIADILQGYVFLDDY
jgi:tetratricopeptide (TPR) repeat protein